MTVGDALPQPQTELPSSFSLGDSLDWSAPWTNVKLYVELPFWLMVPDCTIGVPVDEHTFQVHIRGTYFEFHAEMYLDSRATCVYLGPPQDDNSRIHRLIDRSPKAILPRKCKTVLGIDTRCNMDALRAHGEQDGRRNESLMYLVSLCTAHIPVVNRLIQSYRLRTYDPFAYQVSPIDVPNWVVDKESDSITVQLLRYGQYDRKPVERHPDGTTSPTVLISEAVLQQHLTYEPVPGEVDMVDAMAFMQRGDFTAAVRRVVTAIEALLEFRLGEALMTSCSPTQVQQELESTHTKFHLRLTRYQQVSSRSMPDGLMQQLDRTRPIRHAIVHHAAPIEFRSRGEAQQSVDTGRWIFEWLLDDPVRTMGFNRTLGLRFMGRHLPIFHSEITPEGVVIHGPPREDGRHHAPRTVRPPRRRGKDAK